MSNTGFDVGAPRDDAPVVHKASVLRLDLALPPGRAPVVSGETVIGQGFGEQADKGVFVIGPTGLALGADGTLYISDAIGNRITAIADVARRLANTRRAIPSMPILNSSPGLVTFIPPETPQKQFPHHHDTTHLERLDHA
ncbi:MAG: hypothetical protein ACYCVB_15385 [Bacilli bacterium]